MYWFNSFSHTPLKLNELRPLPRIPSLDFCCLSVNSVRMAPRECYAASGLGDTTVEGMNMAGILLGYLAVLVFLVVSLVALGLLIARLPKASMILFAVGLFCAAVIASIATLSFLEREVRHDASQTMLTLVALIFLVAGAGQFIAAIRNARTYAASLAFAAASIGYTVFAVVVGGDVFARVAGEGALHWFLHAGPGIGLLLATISMLIAILPAPRSITALLLAALAFLGGLTGAAIGDSCVRTTCMHLEPLGRATRVRVEVFVFGTRVSEETAVVRIPDEGPSAIRALTSEQQAWVYGLPAGGAILGVIGILALAVWRSRRRREDVPPESDAVADRPREFSPSSDQIKPA